MSVASTLLARLRTYAADLYSSGDNPVAANARGDLMVAQGLPARTEIVRLGDSWATQILTASAFTYVNAWPTTRSELQQYNADPKKSYIIDSAWMTGITSMAAAQPISLLAQIVPPAEHTAAPTAHASIVRSLCGKSAYSGRAVRAVAVTTALANAWQTVASTNSPMTTNLGQSVYVDLYGLYIVPPGGSFNLAGLAGTAAGTAICGVTWHEVELDVGR